VTIPLELQRDWSLQRAKKLRHRPI
jgi:hypothetical protein